MRRSIVALSAAAGLLAGCTSSSGPGGDPTDTPTSMSTRVTSTSAEPTYPNAEPGEKPPVRPVDVLTDAGAKAFAVYFVKTIDWAYASMDTGLMTSASDATCTGCAALARAIDNRRALGDYYVGSRVTVLDTDVASVANPSNRLVNVVLSYTALSIKHPDGSEEFSADAAKMIQLNLRTAFVGQAWTVIELNQVVSR